MKNISVGTTMDKLKFDLFGWITITWVENGQLCHRKFDTVSDAEKFLKKLKEKGLK